MSNHVERSGLWFWLSFTIWFSQETAKSWNKLCLRLFLLYIHTFRERERELKQISNSTFHFQFSRLGYLFLPFSNLPRSPSRLQVIDGETVTMHNYWRRRSWELLTRETFMKGESVKRRSHVAGELTAVNARFTDFSTVREVTDDQVPWQGYIWGLEESALAVLTDYYPSHTHTSMIEMIRTFAY